MEENQSKENHEELVEVEKTLNEEAWAFIENLYAPSFKELVER